jgi:murein DD-endopeptidase MepM/ murein hydrolase activator NlpD
MKSVDRFELRSGQNPFEAIVSRGVGREDVNQAFASMNGLVDFRYFRPGDRFTIYLGDTGELRGVDIYKHVTEQYRARQSESGWVAEKIEVKEVTSVEAVTGEINVSLWNSLVGQGERAALVTDFVDIFAWDIDFFSDVHPGDTFRILVEKRHADGEFIGYGNILAAEFNSGGELDQAFIHEGADGVTSYFDSSGGSLQKQLLKAPVKYANVTSGFGKRRHPILGYTRTHNGVDYGVPRGTPIWTVGDGRVVRAGRNGGYGNFISVKHANGWVSQYAHLDKILVKKGQRVSQKEMIGRVGSTGMSTGPHLHYELKHNGKFVNPAAQRFARGKSLSGTELEAFKKSIPSLLERMKSVRVAEGGPILPKREG